MVSLPTNADESSRLHIRSCRFRVLLDTWNSTPRMTVEMVDEVAMLLDEVGDTTAVMVSVADEAVEIPGTDVVEAGPLVLLGVDELLDTDASDAEPLVLLGVTRAPELEASVAVEAIEISDIDELLVLVVIAGAPDMAASVPDEVVEIPGTGVAEVGELLLLDIAEVDMEFSATVDDVGNSDTDATGAEPLVLLSITVVPDVEVPVVDEAVRVSDTDASEADPLVLVGIAEPPDIDTSETEPPGPLGIAEPPGADDSVVEPPVLLDTSGLSDMDASVAELLVPSETPGLVDIDVSVNDLCVSLESPGPADIDASMDEVPVPLDIAGFILGEIPFCELVFSTLPLCETESEGIDDAALVAVSAAVADIDLEVDSLMEIPDSAAEFPV